MPGPRAGQRAPGLPGALLTLALAATGALLSSCGNSAAPAPGTPASLPGVSLAAQSGINVMTLTVNGANCAAGSYLNKPCVTVTICPTGIDPRTLPNGSCQTIGDILLDSGSYGLRVFRSVLTPALQAGLSPIQAQGSLVGECVNYADGSADWGQVEQASVILGQETAAQVPIQVIDPSFASGQQQCKGADTSPGEAGFNGILGVGLFAQDCGQDCVTDNENGYYYTCRGGACSGTTLPLSQQVANPVSALATDNNGVLIQLPSVPTTGAGFANGYLILGVGTRSDNEPSGLEVYAADPGSGEFSASFGGTRYASSFLDSGSNAFFFTPPSNPQLPECEDSNQVHWYCPSGTDGFSAQIQGYGGDGQGTASFSLSDSDGIFSSGAQVSAQLGANADDAGGTFDWGLPFYLGRTVVVGIEGRSATLGSTQVTGPYWAF